MTPREYVMQMEVGELRAMVAEMPNTLARLNAVIAAAVTVLEQERKKEGSK